MIGDKPYILFCAGEDSGDCLGESLVSSSKKILGDSFHLFGAGGPKMVSAGLVPLVNFEVLPVSGFGDVLPKYFALRRCYKILQKALENPLCKGLIAIDYPGFNMKLSAVANRLHKPVLYVAPPQAWAWKPKRAKKLSHPENTLAFFFDFEEEPYKKAGCNILQMEHPLVTAKKRMGNGENLPQGNSTREKRILLLPGSRKKQAFRNLPLFLEVAKSIPSEYQKVLVVPRKELQLSVEQFLSKRKTVNFRVEVAPQQASERLQFYRNSSLALSSPGTATLELALAGCQTVVCTKPDFLTYSMGKRLVKTPWFSLPNLILQKPLFEEFIVGGNAKKMKSQIQESLLRNLKRPMEESDVDMLQKRLSAGIPSDLLMSEFLAQFLKG